MVLNEISFPKKLQWSGNSLVIVVPSEYVQAMELKAQEMVDVNIKKRVA